MKIVAGKAVLQNFYIFSFGGCGSTAVAKWLSHWGTSHHLHDPTPPAFLTIGSTFAYKSGAQNVRMDMIADRAVPENSKVIYIYRDPVESMLARPSWGHCCNIGGDWIKMKEWSETLPPSIRPDALRKEYVNAFANHVAHTGTKYMKYEEHFDAWTQAMPSYPVFFLDYRHLWNKGIQHALLSFLELQPGCEKLFPEKKETKKKIDPEVMKKLNDLYEPLNTKISNFTDWFTSG